MDKAPTNVCGRKVTGRRGRLARLEAARRKEEAGDVYGIFEADPAGGVWREVGPLGRTLPLSEEDLHEAGAAQGAGSGLLILAPLGAPKILAGVRWGDL